MTKDRLIEAATRLMAEHGIDGVDLKDIQAAAGQRNRSAVAYHFGDRDGLVRAIAAKHREPLNARRNDILDHLEQAGPLTIERLVDAMVSPLAAVLSTQPGRDYVVILAEGSARLGTTGLYEADRLHTDSIIRWIGYLDPLVAGSPTERRFRIGQALLSTPTLLADLARAIDRDEITTDEAASRVDGVIAFIAGGLSARRHGDAGPP